MLAVRLVQAAEVLEEVFVPDFRAAAFHFWQRVMALFEFVTLDVPFSCKVGPFLCPFVVLASYMSFQVALVVAFGSPPAHPASMASIFAVKEICSPI